MFQRLVAEHATYDGLVSAVAPSSTDVPRRAGYAGFKSIAGYRTGLAVERWPAADARGRVRPRREEQGARRAVRLGHKPLLDTLLHVAFEAAAAQELPVQFHVGYGDPDADLRQAVAAGAARGARGSRLPVACRSCCCTAAGRTSARAPTWPSLYDNVYLDLSYAIPFLSTGEMRVDDPGRAGYCPGQQADVQLGRRPGARAALARRARRPPGHRRGARRAGGGRRPRPAQARAAGRAVLHGNAARVYRFGVTPGDRR